MAHKTGSINHITNPQICAFFGLTLNFLKKEADMTPKIFQLPLKLAIKVVGTLNENIESILEKNDGHDEKNKKNNITQDTKTLLHDIPIVGPQLSNLTISIIGTKIDRDDLKKTIKEQITSEQNKSFFADLKEKVYPFICDIGNNIDEKRVKSKEDIDKFTDRFTDNLTNFIFSQFLEKQSDKPNSTIRDAKAISATISRVR